MTREECVVYINKILDKVGKWLDNPVVSGVEGGDTIGRNAATLRESLPDMTDAVIQSYLAILIIGMAAGSQDIIEAYMDVTAQGLDKVIIIRAEDNAKSSLN